MSNPITRAKAHVRTLTGHDFQNDRLLREALDTSDSRAHQRLAIVGDVLLKHSLVDDWYTTGDNPGAFDRILQTIASNANLTRVGRETGIVDHIKMAAGHFGPISDRIVASTVEAVLGAIYLDAGNDMAVLQYAVEGMGLTAAT